MMQVTASTVHADLSDDGEARCTTGELVEVDSSATRDV
ncbi:hypothetical protein MPS_2188 [Mycobacterium pseudoshottsii JCM 15466]|nr:hypothetical protein MPS_2188 [Mycobacterium pseudoshottsii JCM 15466]